MKIIGLTTIEVEDSRIKNGANILTPAKRTPLWKLFLEKFNDPVIKILLVAALLSLGISIIEGHYAETIGIFVAILLATGVSFFFEMDAAKKFDLLNQVSEDLKYKVIRNGEITEVGKRDLVVGDVVILDTGEEIPSDGFLIESTVLSVNESTLTGEPSIGKSEDPSDAKIDATYPTNYLLRGTSIIEGNAIYRIDKVGDATEFGKVAHQATMESGQQTPLSRQLDSLAKLIGVIGFALAVLTFIGLSVKDFISSPIGMGQLGLLCAALFGVFILLGKVWIPIVYDARELLGSKKERPEKFSRIGLLHWLLLGCMAFGSISLLGLPFEVHFWNSAHWIDFDIAGRILQHFMVAVTLIVVAVPEGLPMSVTLSLALSMRKMLKNNNLVRKMHASETMGAATVICTDKTGTLTQNQMTVHQMELLSGDESLLQRGIGVNSTANLDAEGKPLGNPTEGALLLWLHSKGINYKDLREDIEVQMPFSSKIKMMASVAQYQGKRILFVKGAPEYVTKMCKGYDASQVDSLLFGFQNRAMRTLAFAYCQLDVQVKEITVEWLESQTLTLQAVAAIADPVRTDVPDAVAACMSAGIGIKMVTGDTPNTAREIGRQIGLWIEGDGAENEITGLEWEALSDEEAYERAAKLKIMARARPMDKQRLVSLLQKRGEVVAVTGDGTNDAPALNFANVGLSMGSGTSVAKEASDITLLDDSFTSIANAVMWGRSVYLNIQRFILFQLTINVAALLIVFLGSMLGFEIPLTVTQMLWVNLIMDTFAAGALASLPPDNSVMDNKPRSIKDFIITKFMGRSILITGVIFVVFLIGLLYWFENFGEVSVHDLTIFFTIFVMLQVWNMFNAKAYASGHSALNGLLKSPAFLSVIGLIIVGQILIVSFGGDVFRVEPLGVLEWSSIIAGTSVVLWIGEVVRLIVKRKCR